MAKSFNSGMFSAVGVSTSTVRTYIVMIVILFVSILIGYPPRELDYENVIIPMMQRYVSPNSSIHDSNIESSLLLKDTVIVITGATNGIGLSLTKCMCRYGATIIGLGRSLQSLYELRTSSLCQRRDGTSLLHVYYIDQANLTSVAQVAYEIQQHFPIIHIVVNNAGIHHGYKNQMLWPLQNFYSTTPIQQPQQQQQNHDDYYDQVFVVNYLSHVLLTEMLMDSLLHAQQMGIHQQRQPRIVHTSSTFHWGSNGRSLEIDHHSGNLPHAALPGRYTGWTTFFRGQQSYANSKLAQIYHTKAFSYRRRRQQLLLLQQENDKVVRDHHHNDKYMIPMISYCPMWVGTDIARNDVGGVHIMKLLGYHVNGWGISSALHAMFDTIPSTLPTSSDDETTRLFYSYDYVTNARLPNVLTYILKSSWIRSSSFVLDIMIFVAAGVILSIQKFYADNQNDWSHSVHVSSSPDTFNITRALDLYDWSYQTIQPYLITSATTES